jgi:hypothetical protein
MGLLRKKVDGKNVFRDRTKFAFGTGLAALFLTPWGGDLISGATGNATDNVGKIGGSMFGGFFMPCSISMVSLVFVMLMVMMMMMRQ